MPLHPGADLNKEEKEKSESWTNWDFLKEMEGSSYASIGFGGIIAKPLRFTDFENYLDEPNYLLDSSKSSEDDINISQQSNEDPEEDVDLVVKDQFPTKASFTSTSNVQLASEDSENYRNVSSMINLPNDTPSAATHPLTTSSAATHPLTTPSAATHFLTTPSAVTHSLTGIKTLQSSSKDEDSLSFNPVTPSLSRQNFQPKECQVVSYNTPSVHKEMKENVIIKNEEKNCQATAVARQSGEVFGLSECEDITKACIVDTCNDDLYFNQDKLRNDSGIHSVSPLNVDVYPENSLTGKITVIRGDAEFMPRQNIIDINQVSQYPSRTTFVTPGNRKVLGNICNNQTPSCVTLKNSIKAEIPSNQTPKFSKEILQLQHYSNNRICRTDSKNHNSNKENLFNLERLGVKLFPPLNPTRIDNNICAVQNTTQDVNDLLSEKSDVDNRSTRESKVEDAMKYHQALSEDEIVENSKKSKFIIVNGIEYYITKKLGSGGSSEVFQVLDPDKNVLAIKCVDLSKADDIRMLEGYLNEVAMLKQLQNQDSVIKLFGYEHCKVDKKLLVVMEKGDTDLSSFLKSNSRTIHQVVYYWTEMLNAVNGIHKSGIVHADLKPANFLLVQGRLKLIDFGIASRIEIDVTSVMKDTFSGTINYASPEVIQDPSSRDRHQSKVGFKSDVWSLGCILYSMLYGKTPFQHIQNVWAKLQAITDCNYKIQFPSLQDCPVALQSALKACLQYDPKKRPTVENLLKFVYIDINSTNKVTEAMSDKIQRLSCDMNEKSTDKVTETILDKIQKLSCDMDKKSWNIVNKSFTIFLEGLRENLDDKSWKIFEKSILNCERS